MTTSPTSTAPALSAPQSRSYGQILKSSALIGGSSVLTVCFGIIRNKAMAVLLGPAGVGLMGIFNSISELTRSLAGFGVNNSGVRQIAEAVGSQDELRIAKTVTTLRRVALVTGILGALLLVLLCRPLSRFTFGSDAQAGAIALLGLAVFFGDVSAGQSALVQGMRRIADLARLNVLGAFFGTILSIPLIYFLREKGIVPSLVAVAGMSILSSWWYARQVKISRVRVALQELFQEASALLKLGFVFMASSLLVMGVAYLVRIMVIRQLDFDAAGHYQAAWSLGGFYFSFILQAMGADFYPRLTAVARNNAECNRMVNEQIEVGLLLAVPAVLAALAVAPLVIQLFYSAQFGKSVEVLRWICLGMLLRVVSWPMGFILLAKGAGKTFLLTEIIGSVIQLGLMWLALRLWQLPGTGIAFFALYVLYTAGIYLVVMRVSHFQWSPATIRLLLLFGPVVALVFLCWYVLPHWICAAIGLVAAIGLGLFSLRTLCALVAFDKLPRPVQKLLRLLRFSPDG